MATQQSAARRRVTYFDWLRGLATLAVVLLHTFNFILTDHGVDELGVPLMLVWTELQLVLTRWAVPVFLMITGALLLDPKRRLSWQKIGSYVLRMVAVLAIFGPVYSCMGAGAITPAVILEGWRKVLVADSWDHLWYVYSLIGLYLLTPILAEYTRHASRSTQRSTLMVLAVPTLFISSANHAFGLHLVTFVWVTSSLFYYLLGAYAHRYLKLDGMTLALGTGALVLCIVLCAWNVCVARWYPKWLIRPECPLVAAYSLMLFLIAKQVIEGKPVPQKLDWVSKHSLGVYLFHPLVLIIFYRRLWWMPYQQLPPVLFELVVYGGTLFGAVALAELASRVPGLKKVL